VSVTDKDGNFVSGLRSSDFKVYEGGQLQKITVFKPEDVPVTVGLIVDHSGSMQPKLASVSAAISSFAHSSNLDDEMFVVDFNDRVWPEVFGGKLFTSNVTELEGALMSVAAQGQTALYDAIHEGLQRMRFAHRDKKALIVVSDGGDNSSRRKYSEVLALARQSQTIIYAIGLVGATGQEENPRALERLSKDTGGLAFFPRTLDTVTKISNRIASDLREQYTIGYVPPKKEGDGRFRKVQVNVSSPGQGKLHVRTRTGYSMVQDRPSQAVSRPQP
jgi:VWFA-related protein